MRQPTMIYMDNNATTRVDPRVLATMMRFFSDNYGNAASKSHCYGWNARSAVDHARASIALSIGAASAGDIIFTSGATESINLAIKGVASKSNKRRLITTQIEHKAVLDSCKQLEEAGIIVDYLPVNCEGLVDLGKLSELLDNDVCLVSVMLANNEIGTIQNLPVIADLCHRHQALLHTDATQAIGKIEFNVTASNVDLASFASHKFYGPKGVGALYLNSAKYAEALGAQIHGGGHERGYRSGTLNVPGIVGFAKAIEICIDELKPETDRVSKLRNLLYDKISAGLPGVRRNGHANLCLPGTLNLSFDSIDADALLLELREIALSSGSACTSAKTSPSHVLKAIGLSDELCNSSVRFGLGRFNTEEEVIYAGQQCVRAVKYLRDMLPVAIP